MTQCPLSKIRNYRFVGKIFTESFFILIRIICGLGQGSAGVTILDRW